MRPRKSQDQACSTTGFLCKPQVFQSSAGEGQQWGHTSQGRGEDKYLGAHMSLQQKVPSDVKTLREAEGLGVAASPSLPFKRATLLLEKPQATRASSLEGEV